jgi:zinc transporter ZupT
VPDEDRVAAIVRRARAERSKPSRTMWIVALLLGGACAIGFALLMFADVGPTSTSQRTVEDRGLGFGAGVLVGVVAGIAVGFAIARQRQSSRKSP